MDVAVFPRGGAPVGVSSFEPLGADGSCVCNSCDGACVMSSVGGTDE